MTQDRLRQFRFSTKLKEASYGTAQTRDSLIKLDGTATTEPDDIIDTDADMLGPTMEPNEQESVAIAEMLSATRRYCTLHEALFFIAFGLGKITSTVGTASGEAPWPAESYRHAIRMSEKTILPSFSYSELLDGNAADNANKGILVTGAGVTNFSLTANRGGDRRVGISAALMAKSRAGWPGDTHTEVLRNIGGPILDGGESDIWTGTSMSAKVGDQMIAAGARTGDLEAEEKISAAVRTINWSFDNAQSKDENYQMGGGKTMSAMERGENPNHEVTLTLDYKNQDVLKKFRSQGAFALQWKLAATGAAWDMGGGYHFGLNIIWPRLKYASYKPGRQGAKRTIDVMLKPLPASVSNSVIVNGYNKQATYAG